VEKDGENNKAGEKGALFASFVLSFPPPAANAAGAQAPAPTASAQDPQARVPSLGYHQDESRKGTKEKKRGEREKSFFFPVRERERES
jgi:hypothetical protein